MKYTYKTEINEPYFNDIVGGWGQMWTLSCCVLSTCIFTVASWPQCTLSDVQSILDSYVPVNIPYKLICCCLSGWASGTGHRRPQGADGEAGEGGTGALGVRRYGLAGQPPTAGHSCRPPAPSILFHVRRRPRHKHKRGQPCVRTWPGEEYSTLARKTPYLRFPGSGTSKRRGGTVFAEQKWDVLLKLLMRHYKGGDRIRPTPP